jgi:hypothetical protein
VNAGDVFAFDQHSTDCIEGSGATTVVEFGICTEGEELCTQLITRTHTATDECGNVSSCVQTIFIEDTTPPVITCPADVTIECDDDSTPSTRGQASATDICDETLDITYNDVIQSSQVCEQEYTIIRTWTASDNCGNTSSCTQVITVDDSTAPVIVCPEDATIEIGEDPLPMNTGSASATDNCSVPEVTYSDVTTSGLCPQEYTITRTWTAEDACGNLSTCQQIIEVEDNTPPVCLGIDITISIDPLIGYVLLLPDDLDAGSFDFGGPVVLDISQDSFDCTHVGLNIVDLLVSDACGNQSICAVNVLVLPCPDTCITVNSWVYLEGAATDPNGQPNNYTIPMRTSLNNLHVLPGQTLEDPFFGDKYSPPGQPYSGAPWFYPGLEGNMFDSGGDPMFGDAGYPPTVVDWVLVSLRSDSAGTGGPVCQAAALLHANGYIEFVEEFECCGVDLILDSFYLVVEHRNHLIVMSETKLPVDIGVDSSVITYDFRNQQSYLDDPFGFGAAAQKEILPGVFAMYAGNGEQTNGGGSFTEQEDTDINFNDRTFWEGENGDIGFYRTGDYNLNGDTNFNDRVTWERNNGTFSSVPRD